MFHAAQLKFINEETLLVEFGDRLQDDIYQRVLNLDAALRASRHASMLETLPTFRSLMIRFDSLHISSEELLALLSELNNVQQAISVRRWRVPVCFESPCGEDLAEAAALLGLGTEELVSQVLAQPLRLYMYGFAPGFAYLGGLGEQLSLPRRKNPRAPMPESALMIAGGLASITSVSMPTGWYVLGQVPLTMFDAAREPMVPFSAGDELHLYAVDIETFYALKNAGGLEMIEAMDSD